MVQPGQMIFQVARQDGRDAVFDVPAQVIRNAPPDPKIVVTLRTISRSPPWDAYARSTPRLTRSHVRFVST